MKSTKINYADIGDYLEQYVPETKDFITEHKSYYGEILQHVLFGDFTRFVIDTLKKSKEDPSMNSVYEKCIEFIEIIFDSGDPKLIELVIASFLENLHQGDEIYGEIKQSLPEKLRIKMREVEDFWGDKSQ